MHWHWKARFLIATLVVFTSLVFSLDPVCAIEAGMPNPPSSPTVVKVGIFLADIIDLNEVEETFQAEFIIVAEWEDPRLAFDPAEDGTDMKLFQGLFQFNEVFSGWWPQLLLVNEIGTGDTNAITIQVHHDGRVRYMEQRNVTLETPMKLKPFPFDTQTLEAKMIAFGNYSGQVLLEVDERVLGATEEHIVGNERVNIAQWRLVNLDMVAKLSDYRYYGAPEQLSEIRLNITLERQSANIVWKVIVPLIVLVLLMWAVFWMEVDNLSDRLNVAFIGILTIVAYQFLIDGTMPRISYFTFTDTVLLYSFLVMCLAVLESLILYSMCKSGNKEAAERLDRAVQWAFPIIYFMGLLISYLYYTYCY
ncbi:ligand-gated ion channel [Bythopirellula goksoeyrii]|uniref:Proton-gated ion channel n=1 Tax=Bythopirellula goksoeyrii TaxID=1400387 RepID=A0A5B9Q6M0_9BACT|nr:hypothetical protein [Bythopirellula goksoeyrii]QEG33359.1 Proton-gated ion channel precursor [Bythopirellula goksoeyrii]